MRSPSACCAVASKATRNSTTCGARQPSRSAQVARARAVASRLAPPLAAEMRVLGAGGAIAIRMAMWIDSIVAAVSARRHVEHDITKNKGHTWAKAPSTPREGGRAEEHWLLNASADNLAGASARAAKQCRVGLARRLFSLANAQKSDLNGRMSAGSPAIWKGARNQKAASQPRTGCLAQEARRR